MVRIEDVAGLLESLSFDLAWHEEDLGEGVRHIAIEDPHGQGIAVDLTWAGRAIVATMGHGTVVDLPGELTLDELSALLTDLLGHPSVERWSRSKHQLEVNCGTEGRRFVSSKGFFGGGSSTVRRYQPYRARSGADWVQQ